MSNARAPHWPALDGLRGVAVAAVVAFHLGRLSGGFLGVDLFFALSGYLITTLIVSEAARRGALDLRAFWGRRFRRLLPAVMVMMVVVLGWLARWGTPAEQAVARTDGQWALPYLANWHLIAASRDYWAAATTASVFQHLWSLAIEEQFYVVWPLIAWLCLRRPRGERTLTIVAGVGALASVVCLIALYDATAPTRVYFGTDTRAFALLFGALFALGPVRRRLAILVAGRPRPCRALSIALAVGLVSTWAFGGHVLDALLSGGLVVHSLVAAMLVALLATIHPAANPVAWLLSRRWLVWLGERSYGIYLWHWPVIAIAGTHLHNVNGVARDGPLVAITLALATVSYTVIEQPIRRRQGWAASPTRSSRRATAATMFLAAVAVGVVAAVSDGRGQITAFDASSIAPVTANRATTSTNSASAAAITTTTTTAARVAVPTDTLAVAVFISAPQPSPARADAPPARLPNGPPTAAAATKAPRPTVHRILWIGDSVAADEAPAVGVALTSAGAEFIDGSFAARRLVTSNGVDAEALYPPMVDDSAADLVVVQLSLWDSPFPIEQQRAAFTWFSTLIRATGAQLLFLTPAAVRADLVDPGLGRQIAIVGDLVAADPDGIALLDTRPVWGDQAIADLDGDGAPDRKPDLVHVCPQGAARFAAWLVDELVTRYDGLSPVFPGAWAAGPWTTDARYDNPVGACAALPPREG